MANSTASVHRREPYLKLADGTRWRILDGLTVERDTEVAYVTTAMKPDENWSYTDSNGHLHKYVRDAEDVPRLPSLERRMLHVDCDGACGDSGCGGYEISEWFCRECGDQVEPEFVHDYAAEQSGIPVTTSTTYTLTVEASTAPSALIEGAAYAYADEDGAERQMPLPPLYNAGSEMKFSSDTTTMRTKLTGTQMKAVKHKPTGP